MSVQSRRKPSKLVAATVWGFFWAVLLIIASLFVRGTLQEIRNQAVEGGAGSYIGLYLLSLIIFAVGAFCRVGSVNASKGEYLSASAVFFMLFVAVFWVVLPAAGGGGTAFFLGNPEPGVLSTYEAFYIWLLCTFGLLLLTLSVMNDKYRNKIRIGVGGILFIIGILLPKMLDSYELLRASSTSLLPEEAPIKEQAIETIPMFTMAIAFAATLALLFFVSLLSPAIERFISSLTGDGTDERRSGALSDAQEGAEPEQKSPEREPETAVLPSSAESLPSALQRNSHFGSFTAAVLGGAVIWMIQTVGKRLSGPR